MTKYPFYTRSGAGPLFYMATHRWPEIVIAIPQRYVSVSNATDAAEGPELKTVRFRWRATKPFEEYAYDAERDLTAEEFAALYQPLAAAREARDNALQALAAADREIQSAWDAATQTREALAEAEREREVYRDELAVRTRQLRDEQDQRDDALAALRALAKVQYNGTVEGLWYQMETEDWGDALDIEATRAAYELTLAVLTTTEAAGEQR
jgi:hypothetical protein